MDSHTNLSLSKQQFKCLILYLLFVIIKQMQTMSMAVVGTLLIYIATILPLAPPVLGVDECTRYGARNAKKKNHVLP